MVPYGTGGPAPACLPGPCLSTRLAHARLLPASRGPARPPGLPWPASWGPVRPPGLPPPSGRWVSLRVMRLGSVRCPLLFLLQIVLFPLAAGLAPVCPLRRVTSALSTLCPSWASQSPSGPALPGHPGISSSVDMTTSPDFWSDTPPTPASPHRAWPMAGA